MENIEIAARLTELADLLEIQGANPFRIRAYRNAVRTVSGLTRRVADMVAEGEDLTELPGIGEDLSGHLHELIESGDLEILNEVAREVPRELATLTRLDGVGPVKARKLWKELDITSVDELEGVAGTGRLEKLQGFGRKSVEKILRAISDYRNQGGRFLRTAAAQYLRPLLQHLESAPGLARLEVAGSYRRGVETVGDIDLLALIEDTAEQEVEALGASVMELFTTFPGVARVESSGDTRGRVVLRSGLPVDLRILPTESYGAALHYFTGSKEHNVAIRRLAGQRGLRISEYGVFDVGERRVAGMTEEEVFAAVGLPWIPPELREGRGEIDAASEDRLPKLLTLDDIRGDLHMHTTWTDGRDGIEAMAVACRERGYEYLAVTDHSRAVTVAGGLDPEGVRAQAKEIHDVRSRLEGIRLFHGCEVDILKDGTLDLPDDVLEELDLVLVAVHSYFHLEPTAQTERVLRALEHPMVDILVHPTGRLLGRREPYAMDVEAVLQKARERGIAVEMNANPRRLDLNDRHLFRAKELGVLVSVGTDAHRVGQLGQMEEGVIQARRGWLDGEDVLNSKTLAEFTAWLNRQR